MDTDNTRYKTDLDSRRGLTPDAIKEKIGWHKFLFSLMIAGVIWLITQLMEQMEQVGQGSSTFDRIVGLFGLDIKAELAIVVSLLVLLMGISLSIAIIHENIGRLGDPGSLKIGRILGYFSTGFFLIIFGSMLLFGHDQINVDCLQIIVDYLRKNSLYPKDMPLLVSMGIAIYIAFVAVFYIPYAIIWRCIRTVPKRCARIPMLVWHLRDWFDRLLRKIAPRKSERTRHAVEFDDDAWQIIQDGARKRGIPPNKYLTELAMRAPDDWIDSNSWRR